VLSTNLRLVKLSLDEPRGLVNLYVDGVLAPLRTVRRGPAGQRNL